jgi:hypothetical protein
MVDSGEDSEIITSRHSGYVTKDDVTVELCIYRLAHTKWTLEVVDAEGISTVWDDVFETDDAAYAEFQKTIAQGMLEFQPTSIEASELIAAKSFATSAGVGDGWRSLRRAKPGHATVQVIRNLPYAVRYNVP